VIPPRPFEARLLSFWRLLPRRCRYCGVRVRREPAWRHGACEGCIPF
jgi:hypothetical protein